MSLLGTHRARAALGIGALATAVVSVAVASSPSGGTPIATADAHPPAARDRAPDAGRPRAPRTPPSDGGVAALASEPPEPEESPVVDELIARFCLPYAATVCAARADCGCASSDERGGCDARLLAQCADWMASDFAFADRVDAAAIDACVSAVVARAESCAAPDVLCDALAVASVRPGARCPEGARFCEGGRCDDEHTCRAWPALGDDCSSEDCAPSLVCGPTEACVEVAELGGRCEYAMDCRHPLACRDGRCRPAGDVGAVCDEEEDCAHGLLCGERERCVAPGETCGGHRPECGRQRFCDGERERRCIDTQGVLPLPDVGQRCSWLCAPGALCGPDGRCVPAPAEGRPCADDGLCGPGLACAPDRLTGAQRCIPAAAIGEPCGRRPGAGRCALDAYCDGDTDTCVRRPTAGDPCPDGWCALGAGCEQVIDDGRCIPEICRE